MLYKDRMLYKGDKPSRWMLMQQLIEELWERDCRERGEVNSVYRLRHPVTLAIFYVGITDDPEMRFYQHLMGIGSSIARRALMQELHKLKLDPIMEFIETRLIRQKAEEREKFWIQKYLEQGEPLLNVTHRQDTQVQV